jgi:hypothetical protein
MSNQKVIAIDALEKYNQLRPQVKPVETTWQDLKDNRDGGSLLPGQWYRITDFVTTVGEDIDQQTGEQMTRSAGHAFDILVMAVDSGTLNETAYAIRHDGDEYFANTKMEAWQLKYCLDNDRNRFGWADTVSGKGVIYEMRDEWDNCLPYDFKNIQFKRYMITGTLGILDGYTVDNPNNGPILRGMFYAFNDRDDSYRLAHLAQYMHRYDGYFSEQYIYADAPSATWGGTYTMAADGTRMFCCLSDSYDSYAIISEVDMSKACWCHTFGAHPQLTTTETVDASLTGQCYENHIAGYFFGGHALTLSDNVWCWNNIAKAARHNEITGSFTHNTFSAYMFYADFSGVTNSNAVSGYVEMVDISGRMEGNSISGNMNKVNISGSIEGDSISGDMTEVNISGRMNYSCISGEMESVNVSGTISHTASGNMSYVTVAGYLYESMIVDMISSSNIPGNVVRCTVTTDAGATHDIYNLTILGEIDDKTITVSDISLTPTFAAVDSHGALQVWNPADNIQ